MSIDRRAFGLGAVAAVSVAAGAAAAQGASAPEAVVRQGRLRGFRRNGAEIFLGIPYGADTSGPRRFLPPQPPPSWSGVRDATRLGQRAPQLGAPIYAANPIAQYMAGGRADELLALKEPMGEDCLVLNVLTPRADDRGRPVMVYMHGGGFTSGSGAVHTLGDRFVTEEDVVLVTLNHRLSLLGYLYLGDLSPSYAVGNPGLLDLVAALRWVRDNIAAFGGDPHKVTIFGESGGGAKVSYMLGMPQAKGLFRAAIIQSAGIVSPAARAEGAVAARGVLKGLSLEPADLAGLQAAPAAQLLAQDKTGGMVRPVVDGRTLTQGPWDQGAPATAAGVPVIVGSCADEATLFVGLKDPSLFKLDWPDVASKLAVTARKDTAAFAPAIAAYRRAYPDESASDIFFRMASVAVLGWNARMIADAKAAQKPPVFLYRMEYDTGIPPGLRAFHTCELPLANRMVWQPKAEGLSRQIAGAWAAFARSGRDPNHSGLPRWEPYRGGTLGPIMLFDLETRAGADPAAEAETLLRTAMGAPTLG
jgi:para-nitrobenzyl esterase